MLLVVEEMQNRPALAETVGTYPQFRAFVCQCIHKSPTVFFVRAASRMLLECSTFEHEFSRQSLLRTEKVLRKLLVDLSKLDQFTNFCSASVSHFERKECALPIR